MALDFLLTLQPLTTKNASFSSAALNIKGTPRRGMYAKVFYSAAANTAGSNNFFFQIDNSIDGVNWFPRSFQLENSGTVQGVNLTTAAQAGELNIPFDTSAQYIRLTLNVLGAGTSPALTFSSQIGISRP